MINKLNNMKNEAVEKINQITHKNKKPSEQNENIPKQNPISEDRPENINVLLL